MDDDGFYGRFFGSTQRHSIWEVELFNSADSVGVSLTSPSPKYCVIMKIYILTIIFVLVHGATILAQEVVDTSR